MSIAKRPSKITLPAINKGWKNLLDFLVEQFPLIEKKIWVERFKQNKIHWLSGETVNCDTEFSAGEILCYYREVENEVEVPFKENIIFKNEHFIIADKPHFLPVTPGGQYVNQCLIERLRQNHNLDKNSATSLVAAHRLDRETAGLVLCSINPETRALYTQLFANKKIQKKYLAVAQLNVQTKKLNLGYQWKVSNRIVKSQPKFLMQITEGEANAHSKIIIIEKYEEHGLFELEPITGKTHQLRLHMMSIGAPILNDKFYPKLMPKQTLTFDNPLQLLAKKLSFIDPVSEKEFNFESEFRLNIPDSA